MMIHRHINKLIKILLDDLALGIRMFVIDDKLLEIIEGNSGDICTIYINDRKVCMYKFTIGYGVDEIIELYDYHNFIQLIENIDDKYIVKLKTFLK